MRRPSLRYVALAAVLTLVPAQAQGTHDHGHGSAPMTMAEMNARDVATLKPLRGRAFDVKFAQLMIDHHQMALDMARLALKGAKNSQVRAAAQAVIAAQDREIALMQGWLRKWTGKAHTPAESGMSVSGGADGWFLTEMIPHHQGAVEMAALAATRVGSSAVKKLALEIIRAQNAEMAQYRAWLKTVK